MSVNTTLSGAPTDVEPVTVNRGGTGSTGPNLIAGAGMQITGQWPNLTLTSTAVGTGGGTVTSVNATVPPFLNVSGGPITIGGTLAIGLSGVPLPVVNGGTGVANPGLIAGANITITGSWPNQTINGTPGGGSGTVTHATGPLNFGQLMVGNAGADAAALGSNGLSHQVLHGNPGGPPSFGNVDLTTDVAATILPIANGGSGSAAPALVAGSNISISGAWPNQTVTSLATATNATGALALNRVILGNNSADLKTSPTIFSDGVASLFAGGGGNTGSLTVLSAGGADSGQVLPPSSGSGAVVMTSSPVSGTLVVTLANVALSGANTLSQAANSNRSNIWTGSVTANQALPVVQTAGDFCEITNDPSSNAPFTVSNCSAAPGFKLSAQPGETFFAKSNGSNWISLTPRVMGVSQALTFGATVNTNLDLSLTATLACTGNFALAAPTNPQDGGEYFWWFGQDATGNRICTFDPVFKKDGSAPALALSTAAGSVDMMRAKYYAAVNAYFTELFHNIVPFRITFLDTFTGADGSAPNARWTADQSGWQILSNKLVFQGGSFSSIWAACTPGNNTIDCDIDFSSNGLTFGGFWVCRDTAGNNGVYVQLDSSEQITIGQKVSGTSTTVFTDTGHTRWAAACHVNITIVGSVVTVTTTGGTDPGIVSGTVTGGTNQANVGMLINTGKSPDSFDNFQLS